MALTDGHVNVAEHLIGVGYAPDSRQVRRAWGMWATVSETRVRNISVPAGVVHDGASIPRAFRWLFSRVGAPHQVAAVLHDYCYSEQLFSRRSCDRIYLRVCLDLGVSAAAARVMYVALVVFGGAAWRANGRKLNRLGSGWRSLGRVTEWI